jgi:hypothetical protein
MYRTLIGLSAVGMTSLNAQAAYVGSVVGFPPGAPITLGTAGQSSLTLNPGETFSGAVLLQGSPGDRFDFALFRLVFSEPGLSFSSGWSQWSSPFTTGGLDDFSTPRSNSAGIIDANSYLDVLAPGVFDVSFENLTDNFGDYFFTGMLVSFTLTVPSNFQPSTFTVAFVPEIFSDGIEMVGVSAGSSLSVTVVPAPTGCVLLLAGAVGVRRRRGAV